MGLDGPSSDLLLLKYPLEAVGVSAKRSPLIWSILENTMAFQPAPDIAEVEIRMTLQGVPVENVLHFISLTGFPYDASTIELLAENALANWSTHILPVQCTALSLQSVLAKDLSAEIAPTFEAFPLVPVTGVLTGPAMPNQNAIVLTKRSGLTGRSARGRLYHCGFTEDQVSGNFILPAYADAVNNAYADFVQAMGDDDHQMVILSRRNGGVERPAGIAFNLLTIGLRNNRIDSQRRRMPEE